MTDPRKPLTGRIGQHFVGLRWTMTPDPAYHRRMNSFSRLAAAALAAAVAGCAIQPVNTLPPAAASSPRSAQQPDAPSAQSTQTEPAVVQAPVAPPAHADHGTASASTPVASSPEAGPIPLVDLTPQLLFQLVAADLAVQRGETGAAWSTYHAVARQTRDPRLAARATEIALSGRALGEATRSAQLWRELAPDSTGATQTLQTLLIASGKWDELEPIVAQRLAKARQDGTLSEFYPGLQRSLLRGADRKGAWSMLERLSTPDLGVSQARIARATLAASAGVNTVALAEAREALKLAPGDEEAVITAIRLLAQSPQTMPEAIGLAESSIAKSPNSLEMRTLYARLLLATGRPVEARQEFSKALAANPENASLLMAAAQLAQQARDPAMARQYLDRYLDLPGLQRRERNQGFLMMAQIAEDEGRLNDADEWLAKVPRGEDSLQATTRRALLLGKQGKLEEGRALLRSIEVDSTRERIALLSSEAQLLREAKQPQEAFELLDRNLATYPDQPDLLYDHGMAAERIDRIPEMERSMRKLIELRPDSAHAYNALGYSLADRGLRLDEARSLIEKALSLSPDDPHILDSMGWVLYRQKDIEGALKHLQRAWSISPEADIGAHLGEVLWVQGRQDEARKMWRAAGVREPGNTTLRETLTRLNVSL